MTSDSILVLLILAGAVVLFVSEKLRVDLVALMVLITLSFTGLVTLDEAFSGFASPAVITVWSVYIISGALFVSGVADRLANFMLRVAGNYADRRHHVVFYEQHWRGGYSPTCGGQYRKKH